jgi:ElaB/YqjD/DUF883 family membrane-anchored ribosome-binding protein
MKAKPILVVVITLVIGFVLGMLTSAQIRFNKLKPVRLYFSEERFREGFFQTIQPDEKQKAEIEQILDKYAKMNSVLQNNLRKELDSNIKEMRKELDSMLTKEQLTRLREMDERRQNMIRQGRRNRNDSSDFHDMRPGMRGDRPFRNERPMRQGDRPPFPPPDTNKLPDSK